MDIFRTKKKSLLHFRRPLLTPAGVVDYCYDGWIHFLGLLLYGFLNYGIFFEGSLFFQYANEPTHSAQRSTGWRDHTLIWLVTRSFVTSETPTISMSFVVFDSLQF